MSAQELEVDGATVRLTNPGKVLYPESGTTKLDVAMYYLQVAPVLLPWAKNRPATRKRWVDGVGTEACPGKSFFQKNLDAATPEWVQRQRVHHMDHDNIYPLVNDARTLVWLAQTATLEIHVPQWKLASDGVPQNPGPAGARPGPGGGNWIVRMRRCGASCPRRPGPNWLRFASRYQRKQGDARVRPVRRAKDLGRGRRPGA